jgi:2-C-methyl-D-erythritol 4-phosphate cytidylyltransferase
MNKVLNMKKFAVIVAGGSGSRMGSQTPKQFMPLKGLPVLMHSIKAFYNYDSDVKLVVVLPPSFMEYWDKLCDEFSFKLPHTKIEGGKTRFQSVKNGLNKVPKDALVAIHDGARPLVSIDVIERCFESAGSNGSGVAAVQVKDSIREGNWEKSESKERSRFFFVQTPQTFRADLLKKAFEQDEQPYFTDESSVLEKAGYRVVLTEGDYRNIKITTVEDFSLASTLME